MAAQVIEDGEPRCFDICRPDSARARWTAGATARAVSAEYSLMKEVEDVVAVVNAQRGRVFVLGHSYGGVAALEAAFLTDRIGSLILYEPPLRDRNHEAAADQMERLIRTGQRDEALVTFLKDVVMVSDSQGL